MPPPPTAISLLRALKHRHLSSLALLNSLITRITQHNPTLNAIVVTDLDRARRAARAADRALSRGTVLGPLAGLPITVKEAFEVAGLPTTWGLAQYKKNIATHNAVAVQRLVDAGAIVFGKTNVPVLLADWQSFNPIYGTTRNPWALDRSPGGSSGGAAAALAAGLTTLELGSDIGGSIRNPAHACGVYGLKPSFGVVPTEGHGLPGSRAPLDILCVGPLARSAADLDLALDVLAGPTDAQSGVWRLALAPARERSFADFRVAMIDTSPVAPVGASIRGALGELARFLGRERVRVRRVAPRLDHAELFSLYVHLLRAATSAAHNDPAAFDGAVKAAAALNPNDRSYYAESLRGNTLRHRDWVLANERRHALRAAWFDFFGEVDVLLAPVAPTVAFPHDHAGERWQREVIVDGARRSVNEHLFWAGYSGMFGLPSVVAPIGHDAAGLPIGVQIIGAPGADRRLIRFARLLERAYHRFVAPPAFA